MRVPTRDHPPGERVRCTYIGLPQVARTNELLLCNPFWIWGTEMGANEHGVAIGNESLHKLAFGDFAPSLSLFADERNASERRFIGGALRVRGEAAEERAAFSAQSFVRAEALEAEWRARLTAATLPDRRNLLYALAWQKFQATTRG